MSQTGLPGHRMFQTGLPGYGMFQTGLPGHEMSLTGLPGHGMFLTGLPGHRMSQTGLPGHVMSQTGLPGHVMFWTSLLGDFISRDSLPLVSTCSTWVPKVCIKMVLPMCLIGQHVRAFKCWTEVTLQIKKTPRWLVGILKINQPCFIRSA